MEENYKEKFVLFAHNGIRLLDRDGNLIKTTEQGMEGGEEGGRGASDHEDTGEKGDNYRSGSLRWDVGSECGASTGRGVGASGIAVKLPAGASNSGGKKCGTKNEPNVPRPSCILFGA